jgi:hypothetical protein
MSKKKPVIDHCRTCGTLAQMSWEHVPPRAAPNKQTHILLTFDQMVHLGIDDIPKGPQRQGGVQYPTICGKCNNRFGRLFVPALLEWYWGCGWILQQVIERGYSGAQFGAGDVFPLRIIKGVIAMFMAVNPIRFRSQPIGAALVHLLEDEHATGLPEGIRFYCYLNHEGALRYIPRSTLISGVTQESTPEDIFGGPHLRISEITHPPLGFVMAIGPVDTLDPRLFDITYFADFGYDEQTTIAAELPLLETHHHMAPNDYRTYAEIRAGFDEDQDAAAEAPDT